MVLCVAYVHPDLGSDQNTLNQLGPNEGHFVVSFILYIREMPGLQGCGKQSQRPEQHNTQSQYRSVYNTRKQKHKADAGDTQREGNGMKNISQEMLTEKFLTLHVDVQLSKQKRDTFENVICMFFSQVIGGSCFTDKGLFFVSMSLSIYILQDRTPATQAVPLLPGD